MKEDPLLSIDYLKIINLIKRKKLTEATSDEYNPASSIDSTYLDLDLIEKEKGMKQRNEEEKFRREMEMDQQSAATGERLQLEDQETDTSVRAAKKREERDK